MLPWFCSIWHTFFLDPLYSFRFTDSSHQSVNNRQIYMHLDDKIKIVLRCHIAKSGEADFCFFNWNSIRKQHLNFSWSSLSLDNIQYLGMFGLFMSVWRLWNSWQAKLNNLHTDNGSCLTLLVFFRHWLPAGINFSFTLLVPHVKKYGI